MKEYNTVIEAIDELENDLIKDIANAKDWTASSLRKKFKICKNKARNVGWIR
jgi:hypothetical protein